MRPPMTGQLLDIPFSKTVPIFTTILGLSAVSVWANKYLFNVAPVTLGGEFLAASAEKEGIAVGGGRAARLEAGSWSGGAWRTMQSSSSSTTALRVAVMNAITQQLATRVHAFPHDSQTTHNSLLAAADNDAKPPRSPRQERTSAPAVFLNPIRRGIPGGMLGPEDAAE